MVAEQLDFDAIGGEKWTLANRVITEQTINSALHDQALTIAKQHAEIVRLTAALAAATPETS